MLTDKTRAAESEDSASVRDVIKFSGDLRGEPRVPEGVRADHEAEADARGRLGPRGERDPALEDRLPPRSEDREQVVPRPDRIPTACLPRDCGRPQAPPYRPLRPDLP